MNKFLALALVLVAGPAFANPLSFPVAVPEIDAMAGAAALAALAGVVALVRERSKR